MKDLSIEIHTTMSISESHHWFSIGRMNEQSIKMKNKIQYKKVDFILFIVCSLFI